MQCRRDSKPKVKASRAAPRAEPDAWAAAASTTAGELITTVLFYPVELVKSRMQAAALSYASSSYGYKGLADGILCILRDEGVQGLFTGLRPVILRACASDFVAVYAGEKLLQRFRVEGGFALQDLLLRTLGCCVSVLTTLPLEGIATRVTTSNPPLSTAGAVSTLWAEGGLAAFWRGLRVNMVLCFNPGLTFTALARIKVAVLSIQQRAQMTWVESACAGVFAKFLALLLSYPLMRGKSLVQARDTGLGVLMVLRQVVVQEGLRSLYQGFGAQLSKSLMSAAVKYSLKERTEDLFHQLSLPRGPVPVAGKQNLEQGTACPVA